MGSSADRKTEMEVEIDSMEEKPWRKPGADITDYFNFGFTEGLHACTSPFPNLLLNQRFCCYLIETWRLYCQKQLAMRIELQMQKAQALSGGEKIPVATKSSGSADANARTNPQN